MQVGKAVPSLPAYYNHVGEFRFNPSEAGDCQKLMVAALTAEYHAAKVFYPESPFLQIVEKNQIMAAHVSAVMFWSVWIATHLGIPVENLPHPVAARECRVHPSQGVVAERNKVDLVCAWGFLGLELPKVVYLSERRESMRVVTQMLGAVLEKTYSLLNLAYVDWRLAITQDLTKRDHPY